jgi:hypothetical protein
LSPSLLRKPAIANLPVTPVNLQQLLESSQGTTIVVTISGAFILAVLFIAMRWGRNDKHPKQ